MEVFEIALFQDPSKLCAFYMGQFPQDGENGKDVAFFLFFLEHCCVYVLVLAHLEPELELFEVDDVGNDGDYDL